MSSEAKQASGVIKGWAHIMVMLVLFLGGWLLPAVSTITPFGMRVLGIFAGMIYGWMFVGLIWPSIAGLLFLSFAGLGSVKAVFGAGYGSEIVLLIIFFGAFTKWLEEIGLTSTFAQWLLSRRFLQGRAYLFIFMIFVATFMCGFFVGIYPAIFLMWGICYRLLATVGYAKGERTSAFILIGVAFVSIMGMTIKPWSSWSMLGTGALESAAGLRFSFLPYSFFMLTVSICSILLYLLAGRFLLRIDVKRFKEADLAALSGRLTYSWEQKVGTLMLLLILAALYLPSVLPKDSSLYGLLSGMGPVGVISLVVIVLCIMSRGGRPLLDFADMAAKGVPWNMICLLAAVGPLGTALMHEDAQITPALLTALRPLLAGQSPFVMYALITIAALVLTQFMNNTVLLVALTPMLCQLAGLIGANPYIITALLIFGLSAAMATPGASSRAGLIFGNTEWIKTRDAYRQGILSIFCVLASLLLVGIPLGMALFAS